jgi:hypothetical protein
MKKIYVVRWLSRIDGEEECGNFAVCYADESKARKAMLKDMDETLGDWRKNGEVKTRFMGPDKSGSPDTCDYCGIYVEDDTYDYHDWWIDSLVLDD